MKKISICLLLILFATFTLAADDESEVIVQAQTDATEDGQNYHPFLWGVGGAAITVVPAYMVAFVWVGLSVEAIAAPVLGGTILALIGYFTGKAEVPDARIAGIQNEYTDSSIVSHYKSEYEKTLTKIQRRKRGNYALIGSGVAVGIMGLGFLVVYITK